MKIAVNRCFGGFEMSNQAVQRYLELIGKECYFYKQTKHEFDVGYNEYIKTNVDEDDIFSVHVSTKDLGDKTSKIPNESYFYYGNIERNDSALIQTIEELKEAASGRFGRIQIVEIPDGVSWEISDYDGRETVEEIHRSW